MKTKTKEERTAFTMPLRRKNGLASEEISGELLIYDLERHRAHSLNPAAAFVWQCCNGKATGPEVAALLSTHCGVAADEELVRLAVTEFSRRHLIEQTPDSHRQGIQSNLTRRQATKLFGGLALVMTVLVPMAAHAASCAGRGQGCGNNLDCCPGLDCQNDVCA